MRNKRFAFLLCFTAFLALTNQPVQAQLARIGVGYSAISGDALPAWVAKDAGIFEKNGLDVQLVFFTGGTTAVMALVSADTPITQLAGAAGGEFGDSRFRCRVDRWRGDVTQLLSFESSRYKESGATQRWLGGD